MIPLVLLHRSCDGVEFRLPSTSLTVEFSTRRARRYDTLRSSSHNHSTAWTSTRPRGYQDVQKTSKTTTWMSFISSWTVERWLRARILRVTSLVHAEGILGAFEVRDGSDGYEWGPRSVQRSLVGNGKYAGGSGWHVFLRTSEADYIRQLQVDHGAASLHVLWLWLHKANHAEV